MDQKQREDLAKRIKKAFSDAEYPINDDLTVEYYTKPFAGKPRDEIGLDNLQRSEPLSYFSPTAFRYYLPVFLSAVVLHPYGVDVLASDIITKLTPIDDEDFKGTTLEGKIQHLDYRAALVRKTQLFSQKESQAVYEFMLNYEKILPDGRYVTRRRTTYEKGIDFWKEKANS